MGEAGGPVVPHHSAWRSNRSIGSIPPIEPRSRSVYLCHMFLCPRAERHDRLAQRAPEVGQCVFDLGWRRGEHRSGHHAVPLKTLQGAGKHLLRDTPVTNLDYCEFP
jgi:hypothetical protein